MTLTYRQRVLAAAVLTLCILGTIFVLKIGLDVDSESPKLPTDTLPTLRLARELKREYATYSVTWSSDSSKIAAYSDYSDLITVWNVDGTVASEIHRHGDSYFGSALSFVGHDTEIIARPQSYTETDIAASVYDLKTGAVVQRIAGPHPGQTRAPFNWATAMASSPNQSMVAVLFRSAYLQPAALYSTEGWNKLTDIPNVALLDTPTDTPIALAFSANGASLAIAMFSDVIIYDMVKQHVARRIAAYNSELEPCCVTTVALNPDASLVAVGSGGDPNGNCLGNFSGARNCQKVKPVPVRVIRVEDGTVVASHPQLTDQVWDVQWSPDGKFVAFVTTGFLHIWDPFHPEHQQKMRLPGQSGGLAFAPNGKWLAVCDGRLIRLFDVIK